MFATFYTVDFGLAAEISADEKKRNTLNGSTYWMSPEMIHQLPYGTKTDIYRCICIAVWNITC